MIAELRSFKLSCFDEVTKSHGFEELWIGYPHASKHPLYYQSLQLKQQKKMLAVEAVNSFEQLYAMSQKHQVPYVDLVTYALGSSADADARKIPDNIICFKTESERIKFRQGVCEAVPEIDEVNHAFSIRQHLSRDGAYLTCQIEYIANVILPKMGDQPTGRERDLLIFLLFAAHILDTQVSLREVCSTLEESRKYFLSGMAAALDSGGAYFFGAQHHFGEQFFMLMPFQQKALIVSLYNLIVDWAYKNQDVPLGPIKPEIIHGLKQDLLDYLPAKEKMEAMLSSTAEEQYQFAERCRLQGPKKENYTSYIRWLEMSANGGHAPAQSDFGVCCLEEFEDQKAYFKWTEKAAKAGNIIAKCNLGNAYQNGTGCQQNLKKGFKFFLQAAHEGFAAAQNNVGLCFWHGKGCAQNYRKSHYWLEKAANQRNFDAHYNLGLMYEKGGGVTASVAKALGHYIMAADLGHHTALDKAVQLRGGDIPVRDVAANV